MKTAPLDRQGQPRWRACLFGVAMLCIPIGAATVTACGAVDRPAHAVTTIVSLRGMPCTECGHEIAVELRGMPGVYDATFNEKRVELAVTASPGFDVIRTVREQAAVREVGVALGAGKGSLAPPPTFPENADIERIPADNAAPLPALAELAVPGKVTVVDVSATWCRPCQRVEHHMAHVLGEHEIAYRVLDLGAWDSPELEEQLDGLPSLPFIAIFDSNRQQIATISGAQLDELDAAIDRLFAVEGGSADEPEAPKGP